VGQEEGYSGKMTGGTWKTQGASVSQVEKKQKIGEEEGGRKAPHSLKKRKKEHAKSPN